MVPELPGKTCSQAAFVKVAAQIQTSNFEKKLSSQMCAPNITRKRHAKRKKKTNITKMKIRKKNTDRKKRDEQHWAHR